MSSSISTTSARTGLLPAQEHRAEVEPVVDVDAPGQLDLVERGDLVARAELAGVDRVVAELVVARQPGSRTR